MSKGSLITTCDPILMEGEGQRKDRKKRKSKKLQNAEVLAFSPGNPILMEEEGQQPRWQFSTEKNKTIDCRFSVMKINIENTLLI